MFRRQTKCCSRACSNKYSGSLKEKKKSRCKTCNGTIPSTKKYCSRICYYKSKNTLTKRLCPSCEKSYKPKNNNQKFCSVGCSNVFNKSKTKVVSVCVECKNSFHHWQSLKPKFCSTKCKYANMSKDPKIAERFSRVAADRMVTTNGLVGDRNNKCGYYKTNKSKSGKVFHRSSYELAFLQIVDADPNVVSIIGEPFSIEYKINNKCKRYVPDFLYETKKQRKYLAEVKPNSLLQMPINIAKFKAAKKYCQTNDLKFEVWDENKLTDEALKFAKKSFALSKR